jgi:hypothetical protein
MIIRLALLYFENRVYHRKMVSMEARRDFLSSPRDGGLAPRPEGRRRARGEGLPARSRVVSSSWTGVWLTGSAALTRLLGTELPPPSLMPFLPSAGMVPECGSESRRDGRRMVVGGVDHLSPEEERP